MCHLYIYVKHEGTVVPIDVEYVGGSSFEKEGCLQKNLFGSSDPQEILVKKFWYCRNNIGMKNHCHWSGVRVLKKIHYKVTGQIRSINLSRPV